MSDNRDLIPVKAQVTKMLSVIEELEIADEDGLKTATAMLGKIKAVGRIVREKKEEITKPMNEALRKARDLFRPLEDACDGAERVVKARMLDYANRVEAERRAQAEKLEARVDKGTMKQETAIRKVAEMPVVASQVSGGTAKAQFRTVRGVRVTDPGMLPRKYLVPDMVVIRRDALAGEEIPGVEVVEEKVVAGLQDGGDYGQR